jgi:putative DNA-binding protein
VQSLAEIQSGVRHAVATGDFTAISPLLVGGQAPSHRLAIHRRHYETSLITALLDKFPATTWLLGSRFISAGAKLFVAMHPPCTPCIAEYGQDFPAFLATCQGADRVPYLSEFSQLEWHIGHVAIAINEPPGLIEQLSALPADVLLDGVVTLQSGVRYLRASWPVDELMKIYLAETRPEHFNFEPAVVCLEIRGARGEFQIDRLGLAEFIFRKSISEGRSIGDAAGEALEIDSAFDSGKALVALLTSGLVAAIERQHAAGRER